MGSAPHKHLAHLPSFYDNPIVYITACSYQRRKILASGKVHEILREIWIRSAEHDGWWVGHYIIMPDHVHFFARPEREARSLSNWIQMWKSVSSRRIAKALGLDPARLRAARRDVATYKTGGPGAGRLQTSQLQSSQLQSSTRTQPLHVWQEDYFDRYLRSGESYSEKWDYIAQNAVRAGLVEREAAWPYQGSIHDLRF